MSNCTYCNDPFGNHRDHVVPKSFLRTYRTVPACEECNTLLGNLVLPTIELRKEYLRTQYLRALLVMPWVKLAQKDLEELGPNLKNHVLVAVNRIETLRSKVAFLEAVESPPRHARTNIVHNTQVAKKPSINVPRLSGRHAQPTPKAAKRTTTPRGPPRYPRQRELELLEKLRKKLK